MNILADIPANADHELFNVLLEKPHCRIERIVSYGQSSPEGFWYEQPQDEWVMVLQGEAELDVSGEIVQLAPGDHLLIPAGVRHRVIRTSVDVPTIWLAVFC